MKQQPLDHAITTADLASEFSVDEPKGNLGDLFFSASQVGVAVSLCWMVHCFV